MSAYMPTTQQKLQQLMRYLLVLALVAGQILHQAGAADQSKAQEVKILGPHYPPYCTSQNDGMLIEIVAAAFEAVDIKAKFSVVPIRRGGRMLAAGEADGFIGGKIFSENEQLNYIASEPILYVLPTFFSFTVPLSPLDKPLGDDRLKDYKIGSIFNSPYQDIYASSGLDVTYISTPELLVRMTEKSRIDIFGSSLISGFLLTRNLNASLIDRLHYNTWGQTPMGLTFIETTKGKKLLESFQQGIDLIQENGTYIKIMEAYWGPDNIPSKVLPDSMRQHGTDDFNIKEFLSFDRGDNGRIISPP